MRTVVVLAGAPARPAPFEPPPDATVVAADGGADHAAALGVTVDLVVGDLDSLPEESRRRLEAGGVRFERHPAAKDASDLELALAAARALEPERIVVVSGGGGRLDHLLAELLLLGSDTWAGIQLDASFGAAAVHVVRGHRVLAGEPGELISLFAVGGPAEGVVTSGLLYPLAGETLAPGSTRGLSNAFTLAEARIELARGVVLAVRPTGSAPAGS